MALMTKGQPPVRAGDQTTGALEHSHGVVFFAQCMNRRRAIRLNLGRAEPEQPRGFPRVRRDHTALGQADPALGQQVQRIGVPDLRQGCVGGRR
ncbi:hypothetical protein D9M73_283100 [compost metagenome]